MRLYFLLLIFIGALISCNDEISIGSSLLEDGAIQVDYSDSIAVDGKSVFSEPIVSYRNSNNFIQSTYLLGNVIDPDFGRSKAEVFFSASLLNQLFPDFDTLKIDSVMLVIPLDTLGQFGEDESLHDIRVHQLTNPLIRSELDTIFSDQSFESEMTPLAEVQRTVSHRDSLDVFSPLLDTTLKVSPQLRVPLDTNLWHEIAIDTLINKDPSAFIEKVKGFRLVSESTSSSIIGLNLGSNLAVIELYYSDNDTTKGVYVFDIASVRSNYFEHDYSGSPLLSDLETEAKDRWYLQEMQGVDTEIDLSPVMDFSGSVINRATLEINALFETNPVVNPVDQLSCVYTDTLGTDIFVFDNIFQIQQRLSIDIFGGNIQELEQNGTMLIRYSLDITNHVNSVIAGDIETSQVRILSSSKSRGAGRTIVYGPDSAFPPVIKLVTSNP